MMRRLGLCGGLFLLVAMLACGSADVARAGDGPLVKLAEVGPWSSVSTLIGFGDRLWLTNSVKHVNHNSADLYSYDPASGALRYERHLFSQDAGEPCVLDGRLYWPFEDPRGSGGVGEFMVTDGVQWDWRIIPGARAFHTHVCLANGTTLYAAVSAWRALLLRSDDGGLTWRGLYRHPTEDGRVSRITALAMLGGRLFAGVTAETQLGPKLLVEGEMGLKPLQGWPESGATTALVAFNGQVYGVNWHGGVASTWRTDGDVVERIAVLDDVGVRAFAATAHVLYAISANGGNGALWRSEDGLDWELVQELDGAEPESITIYAGKVYVGTEGPGTHGALWGPMAPAAGEPALVPTGALPLPPDSFEDDDAVASAFAALDAARGNPAAYGHGFAALLYKFSRSRRAEVGTGLAERLVAPFPGGEQKLFGGAMKATPRQVGRWYMLRAMGLAGHGRVPPAFIAEPFVSKPNGAEKYLDIAPLAIWVAGELGQDDAETIAALIARLGNPDDRPWLDGDIVGALSALTGERFGYDRAAWRAWWTARTTHSVSDAINRSAAAKSSGLLTLKNGSTEASENSMVANR